MLLTHIVTIIILKKCYLYKNYKWLLGVGQYLNIYIYSVTCLIWHTKGPGKCVGLHRMSEYSGFILVNRNTLGPYIFVGCDRMSGNWCVGLHQLYCITFGSKNLYTSQRCSVLRLRDVSKSFFVMNDLRISYHNTLMDLSCCF